MTAVMPHEVRPWPAVDNSEEAWARTLAKEREWITHKTLDVLRDVRHGLNDCYALLAPVDPGSTLVVSTPRAEKVKGTITRVGTQIVKGLLHIQLATQAPAMLTISPSNPIKIAPLATIHAHLTQCTDLASLLLSSNAPTTLTSSASAPIPTVEHLYAQLRIMAHAIADSIALLAGPNPHPLPSSSSGTATSDHSHSPHRHHGAVAPPPPASALEWTTASLSSAHFSTGLPPWLSAHMYVHDSFLTLSLRALEPVAVPLNIGTKFALAIGTMRRLEHDEMNRVFLYKSSDVDGEEVYVREKIEVESADPCLMSLATKLTSLSHTLAQARRNLAAVLDVEFEE